LAFILILPLYQFFAILFGLQQDAVASIWFALLFPSIGVAASSDVVGQEYWPSYFS
jgi:hypothetical protein